MNFIGGRCDRKWRFSKKETAFGGVQKNLNGENFMNFIGGRCDRKWRFSNRETAFGVVQKFFNGEIFMNLDDATENGDFQKGIFFHGGDVHENHLLLKEN